MAFCDFVIKYDPEKDNKEILTKRILKSIIISRLKSQKPAIMFIGGDSGEGKSYATLRLQEILLEVQGLDIMNYVDACNIFTPLEYAEKVDAVLENKELKKLNIVGIHEAREIVKAKNWHSFLSQSVSDINAMSRRIKPLCIIIISQFIRDITNDTRYTLNFYCMVRRPKGKKARLYINMLWKDDRDLEKPKLRKRKLSGYLVYPNGRYRRFVPQYIELTKPNKDLRDIFDKLDYESKAGIIKRKLSKLIEEMKADIGEESNKITSMVEWYSKDINNLHLIGRNYKGKWIVKKEISEMHDLNKIEVKLFEKQLNKRLLDIGMIGGEKDGETQSGA